MSNTLFAVTVLIAALISLAIRSRMAGHLVTWDEAMQLCTVRSVLAGWDDAFSEWFWRHPPLFSALMFLMQPFQAGFAERTALMAACIAAFNLILLAHVLERTHGRTCALAACVLLATMPGACFFDVWIKTDHTVTTFALLAILAARQGYGVRCGLLTGLALLSKETACFYAIPLAALLGVAGPGKTAWRRLTAWAGTAFASSAWWYLFVSPYGASGKWTERVLDHVRFAGDGGAGWHASPAYYLAMLPELLGVGGCLLALIGAVTLAGSCAVRLRTERNPQSIMDRLWPLLLLVPSLALLSGLTGKVPWIVICLLPGFALLEGYAFARLLTQSRSLGACAPTAVVVTGILLIIGQGPVYRLDDYERILKSLSPDQYDGSTYSRQIAQTLTTRILPDQRVLLTSFHYWRGIPPAMPCPVFTCYFTGQAEFLVRPYTLSFEQLETDIRQHRIDWAVLSPEPGPQETALFGGMMETLNLHPVILDKAYLFETAGIR